MKYFFLALAIFALLGGAVWYYLRSITQSSDINIITTMPGIVQSPVPALSPNPNASTPSAAPRTSPTSSDRRYLGPPVGKNK